MSFRLILQQFQSDRCCTAERLQKRHRVMCSRGDFNFFLGLSVGKPDAAVYLEDVAGCVNGLENLDSQVGDVLAQLVGSVEPP
ncbi:hypothetical protein AADS62_004925 [Escherichia coli]